MYFPTAIFIYIFSLWVLANFGFGGLDSLNPVTNYLVGLSLTTYFLGAFFSWAIFSKIKVKNGDNNNFIFKYKLFFKIISPAILFIQTALLIRFTILYFTEPENITRLNLLGYEDNASILFLYPPIQLIYSLVLGVSIKLLLITSFVLTYFTRNIKYLIIANLVVMSDSFIFLGRGFILDIIFQFIIFIILNKYYKYYLIDLKTKLILLLIFTLLISLGPVISIIRGDIQNFDSKSFFYNNIINYHTVGFNILDQELIYDDSRLNLNTTYGLASLGGIERIFVLLIRRYDKSVDSVSGENGKYLNEFRELGMSHDNNSLKYNAFATIFYTFYLDGGLIFSLIASFIIGFYITRIGILIQKGKIIFIPLGYLCLQSGMSSVFFSPIESFQFWPCFIILIIISKYRLKFP